jgi:putative ABC transport system substrate-binding protein
MKRREFIMIASAVAAWPLVAPAQQAQLPRIGILLVGNREPFSSVFREGLRDLGYIEHQNFLLEMRSSEGKLNLLSDLASELVRLGVNIIVASETPAVQAAKRATSDIPIVMAPSGDPVGTGLIASLARPGGNVTGLSAATAELAGKGLELVREILPSAHCRTGRSDESIYQAFHGASSDGWASLGFRHQARYGSGCGGIWCSVLCDRH